jgi:predicted alpha/beta superfamily hydrolase
MSRPVEPAFKLTAQEISTEYWIYVVAPDVATEPGPWPAMVFLDGDDLFEPALAGYQQARARNETPPLLMVGIGYGASFGKPGNQRIRDYTPSQIATEKGSGASPAFLRFLRDELWLELIRRYAIRDDIRVLGGHSLGSLLVLDALFQIRPVCTHFLASAPSLWWDERVLLGQAARLRKRQENLPAQAYLSAGSEDSESMLGDLELLQDQLSSRPFARLTLTFERIPRRNHFDVVPDAVRAGLRTLLPGTAAAAPA